MVSFSINPFHLWRSSNVATKASRFPVLASGLSRLAIILSVLASTALPIRAQGYLNPPLWSEGYYLAPAGTTVATKITNSRNPPVNLNALAQGAITTWNITLPSPVYDGQIVTVACPGGNVTTINITSIDGSTIGTLPTANCTAGNLYTVLQFAQYQNQWFVLANSSPFINYGATGSVGISVQSFLFDQMVDVLAFDLTGTCRAGTDCTSAIQNATTYATGASKAVYFPGSTNEYPSCTINMAPKTAWVGDGPTRSVIKLKNSCNASLMNNNGSHVIDDLTLLNIGFDGNSANNNSNGDMIVQYGAHPTFMHVYLWNVAGNAIQTNFDITNGSRLTGFEGSWIDVQIDTVGKSCWVDSGPNDSDAKGIIMTDCGLAADNSYYGLFLTGGGNGRWSNVHYSNRATTTTAIPIAGVSVNTSGNDFSDSHFEGGYSPLSINATVNTFKGAYYAPRGSSAVNVTAGYNYIAGVVGINAYSGNTSYICINLTSPGNIVDITSSNCNNGVINFGVGESQNLIRVRGTQAAGIGYASTPAASDTVDLQVVGGATSNVLETAPNAINNGAWTNYTPSMTYTVAPTTATSSGSWKQIGTKTYQIAVSLNVSSLGSGSGLFQFSLPNSIVLTKAYQCAGTDDTNAATQYAIASLGNQTITFNPSPSMAAHVYSANCTVQVN